MKEFLGLIVAVLTVIIIAITVVFCVGKFGWELQKHRMKSGARSEVTRLCTDGTVEKWTSMGTVFIGDSRATFRDSKDGLIVAVYGNITIKDIEEGQQ